MTHPTDQTVEPVADAGFEESFSNKEPMSMNTTASSINGSLHSNLLDHELPREKLGDVCDFHKHSRVLYENVEEDKVSNVTDTISESYTSNDESMENNVSEVSPPLDPNKIQPKLQGCIKSESTNESLNCKVSEDKALKDQSINIKGDSKTLVSLYRLKSETENESGNVIENISSIITDTKSTHDCDDSGVSSTESISKPDLNFTDEKKSSCEQTETKPTLSDTTEEELCAVLSDYQKKKVNKITSLLISSPVDVATLQDLAAQEDGFINDAVRQNVWPRLLHVHDVAPIPLLDRVQASDHHSFSQVVLDVERTLKRFPPGISSERRTILMDQLIRMIVTVLKRNPDMHYYQGYHDVGITFLLVCGEDAGVLLLEELSLTHLREFLQPTMERTQRWLAFLYPILASASPALHQHMIQSGVGTVFCLAWLITWYAHTLSQYRQVVRLYDFLLSSPPLMPMYVAAAILHHREQQLLAVECDMAMMHHSLSQVPDDLPLDHLLQEALRLYRRLPPPTIAEQVDKYMEEQKQQEALELEKLRAAAREREKRMAAARARRNQTHLSWVASVVRVMPRGLYSARGAGAVAVLAVVVGITAIYCKNQGSFRMLPLPW